jgi:small subunit ribosomal protein S6
MKAYELLYMLPATAEDEVKDAVSGRIETAIVQGNGKVESTENWGIRKLAYQIGDLTDADYTLVEFSADESSIAELDRVLRINDAVVRHMITARPVK